MSAPAARAGADGGGDHARGNGVFLTGVRLNKSATDIRAGISIDQAIGTVASTGTASAIPTFDTTYTLTATTADAPVVDTAGPVTWQPATTAPSIGDLGPDRATLGGVVVTRGFVDESTMISIVGALVTLAGAAWSVYAKRTKAKAV